MAITKAQILSFTNSRLQRADSASDIEESIKMILRDIASFYVLDDEDTSQTLTSSDLTLDYPSDALDGEQAIKSVILTDSSSVQQAPLTYISGGWRDYNRLMDQYTSGYSSYPASMVCFRRKIYLWPPPSQNYTVSIEYYKRHPEDVDNIEYTEDWRNAILAGVTREVAYDNKMTDQIVLWENRYMVERDRQIMLHREDVAVVESPSVSSNINHYRG
jgi:hypothetical protein